MPKLHHRLELSRTRGDILHSLDKLVRRQVREWTKLTHDTSNSYIHADVKAGGLGVPCLRLSTPFMKGNRLKRLATSVDPMISPLVSNYGMFARECAVQGHHCEQGPQ